MVWTRSVPIAKVEHETSYVQLKLPPPGVGPLVTPGGQEVVVVLVVVVVLMIVVVVPMVIGLGVIVNVVVTDKGVTVVVEVTGGN